MTETEHRFLKAIAERIAPERVAEVRLFPAIKQGHMQSAVAVVAAEVVNERPAELAEFNAEQPAADAPVAVPLTDDATAPLLPEAAAASEAVDVSHRVARFSVLTARYRLTLKGPERGKWEFELLHDADAPLDTVERVVHGVVRRAGDAGEPQLLSQHEFRRAVTEQWWNADNEPR